MTNNNPTKKQHYVPRKHLRAWCQNDGKLFARRYNAPAFKATPEGVAFENSRYEFKSVESELFEAMIVYAKSKHGGHISQFVQSVLRLSMYATVSESLITKRVLDDNAKRVIAACRRECLFDQQTNEAIRLVEFTDENQLGVPPEFDDLAKKFLIEGHEPLMSAVEHDFWPILDRAQQGLLPLPLSDNDLERFVTYVCAQLFRTPKYSSLLNRETPALEPISPYLLVSTINDLIVGMMTHKSEDELSIIDNHSELPFVTGDQPLLNLLPASDNPQYFDIFFPISPTKAFFYAKKGRLAQCYSDLQNSEVAAIHRVNQCLCNNCTQFVFASTADTLEHGGYAVPQRNNPDGTNH